MFQVLKLICVQSFCNNGLRQKLYDYYKREIIQVSMQIYCQLSTILFLVGNSTWVDSIYLDGDGTKCGQLLDISAITIFSVYKKFLIHISQQVLLFFVPDVRLSTHAHTSQLREVRSLTAAARPAENLSEHP